MFDIYLSCRLCLKPDDGTLISCTEIQELSNSVHDIFGFKISQTDECSTKICRECISKVTSFSMYRNGVLNNQKSIKQYKALQAKLDLSVKNNQAVDHNVSIASQIVSPLSPVSPSFRPLNVLKHSSDSSVYIKTYARKSTAKPCNWPIKNNVKFKKLKIVCRKLKESDVLCVVLNNKDRNILNLKGKTDKKQDSHTGLLRVMAVAESSNNIPTIVPKIEKPDLNMPNIIETAVSDQPQNAVNISEQNIVTDQKNVPSSSGYVYINPAAITKTRSCRPILPKAQLPIDQIAEKMGVSTTGMITPTASSTPNKTTVSAALPVITEVYNQVQNISNLEPSSTTAEGIIPTQNACQYNQQMMNSESKKNTNNFGFGEENLQCMQGKYPTPTQYSTNSFQPAFQSIPNHTNTVPYPSNVTQNNQIDSAASLQKQPCIVNPRDMQINSSQMNHVPASVDEVKCNSPHIHYDPTISDNKQALNEKRVKVLSVGELNMKAAATRKLPLLITLIKIKNEIQIKLTDSTSNEIHYTNLSPQEQTAVKSNLLQPSSREQILTAIKTCTLDQYSQDMLTAFGITIRLEEPQYRKLLKQMENRPIQPVYTDK